MNYFRNHNYPTSIYKNNGGKKFKVSLDVNGIVYAIVNQSYIDI